MMAQQQKARKQPQDPYAQRGKTLASSVQRLRGWVGTDPSRTPELADALVELTGHRLLGHSFATAGVDAQESVRRAAELLTANGPIGPYTSVTDATRYVTAVVQLAALQSGVGLPDAAGRTLESLEPVDEQLRELQLDVPVPPTTEILALWCLARSALAAGEVATANAYTDAVLSGLAGSGLSTDVDDSYLAVDAARLASDCRWSAGQLDSSVSHLRVALERYAALVGGRLSEPRRLSPALVERLAEPLFGLYRDLADRLIAIGEVDLGLVTRRDLVETLRGLTGPLGEPARIQLASALADLAADLWGVDRLDEAEAAAAEAASIVPDSPSSGDARLLAGATWARVLIGTQRPDEAVRVLRQVLPLEVDESSTAAHAVGLSTLAEALRASGDLEAAAAAYAEVDA